MNQCTPNSSALPATLRHSRDVAVQRQLAEAEAAEGKLPEIGAGPAAALAAVPQPDLVLRRLGFFGDLRSGGHRCPLTCCGYDARKGMPSSCSSLRDSSSVFAVVTTEMFMPRALSTFM